MGAANTHHSINLSIAYPGLALKGALWASFGGAGLGLALAAYLYRKRDLVIGVLLMVAAFYIGWWVINRPKLIYFSIDRREIWGGLWLAGPFCSSCGRLWRSLACCSLSTAGYPILRLMPSLKPEASGHISCMRDEPECWSEKPLSSPHSS